jgi:hypothetical protein
MRKRLRKKMSKRFVSELLYVCPECGGEVITMPHPMLFASAHEGLCSFNNRIDFNFRPALELFLVKRMVSPNVKDFFLITEQPESADSINDSSLTINHGIYN